MNRANRIKNIVGYFGILMLAYAAGVATVLLAVSYPDAAFIARICVVGVLCGGLGIFVLRSKLAVKGVSHGRNAR